MEASDLLRSRSRLVLGNRYRAELIMALARSGKAGVSLGELAGVCGAEQNVYNAPIKALLEAGLAERLPRVPGDRRRHYRPAGDAALWRALGEMVEHLSGYASPEGMAADRDGPDGCDDGRG